MELEYGSVIINFKNINIIKYGNRKIIKKYWKQYKIEKTKNLKNKLNKIIYNDLLNIILNY